MGCSALGGRLPERESPGANKEAALQTRDDSWDGLCALESDVIPDALQHSYGAALIRDLKGLLPCWDTA